MRHKALSRLLLITALLPLFLSVRWSGAKPEVQASLSRPKVLLLIVIDQFQFDYLTRFRPYFVRRGFNLLLSGANFVDCRYTYATTATGPGFASLSADPRAVAARAHSNGKLRTVLMPSRAVTFS